MFSKISPDHDLPSELAALRQAATAEGYRHITRLCADWSRGTNRFDRPGECLHIAHDSDGVVIACGGLSVDPYEPDGRTGRIRRVYVAPPARGRGVGRRLIAVLLADHPFAQISVRAGTEAAGRFYVGLGFVAVSHPTRTHLLSKILL